MLKYKRYQFASIADTTESLTDMLAGKEGVSRRVVSLGGEKTASQYLRVYLDAEQIVDVESDFLTTTWPLLPMDVTIASGQLLKVGYYNNTGGAVTTQEIVIGYEEK